MREYLLLFIYFSLELETVTLDLLGTVFNTRLSIFIKEYVCLILAESFGC